MAGGAGASTSASHDAVPALPANLRTFENKFAQYKTPGLELRDSDVREVRSKPEMTAKLYDLFKLEQLNASVNLSLKGPRLLLLVTTGNIRVRYKVHDVLQSCCGA